MDFSSRKSRNLRTAQNIPSTYDSYINTRINTLQRIMDGVPIGSYKQVRDSTGKLYQVTMTDEGVQIARLIETQVPGETFTFPNKTDGTIDWDTPYSNIFNNTTVEEVMFEQQASEHIQEALDLIK